MSRFKWLILIVVVVVGCCQPRDCEAQDSIQDANNLLFNKTTEAPALAPSPQEMVGRSDFHKAVLTAARASLRKGELKPRDMITLRIAMLSPSFRERAKDLAVIQLSASGMAGDAHVPVNDEGRVLRASIDWDAIINFIERLIPLILQLIQIFSGVADVGFQIHDGGGALFASIYLDGQLMGVVT